MLDYVMIFAVMFVIFYLMTSFITAVIGKIGHGIHVGSKEDQPDYVAPVSDPLEDECEAYLNRRPL